MKTRRILFLPLFVALFCSIQTSLANQLPPDTTLNDGPYIFYSNGHGWINSIEKGQLITTTFKEKHKNHQQLVIRSKGETNSFSLKLHLIPGNNQSSTYPYANKILVVSDIEGEFTAFLKLMKSCQVIDSLHHWSFGDGQLVICGDLFDRGKDVAAYLWFLYHLEEEAKATKGYVHVILGNHDIMNLSGDYRYVDSSYFQTAQGMGKSYSQLYGPDTELGQWLRSKNIIEKIGNLLFLHGGIAPEITQRQMSVEAINNACRPYYDKPRKSIPDSLQLFFGAKGPFWYRGYFMEPNATEAGVDSTLQLYGVNKIFVGHTIVDNIQSLYNGKVIAVDVDEHDNNHQALLINQDKYYRIDDKGVKTQLLTNDISKR